MKIAVTGASGRIGRAITEMALARGHQVVAIDRVALPAIEGLSGSFVTTTDDYDALVAAFKGCDALVHMAAIPSPGNLPDHVIHNNNVVGSYNALRAAVENGIMRICQASSVNAIGHSYSRRPHYDYFPLDEEHPNYSEEPYSLSKWICEQQADAFARRYEDISIASLRFHYVVPDRRIAHDAYAHQTENAGTHLWAWTHLNAAADASLRGIEGRFKGHEAFFIVSPTTVVDTPSAELSAKYLPEPAWRQPPSGNAAFFSSAKAERILGWNHDAAAKES
jgi:nucleoside-diphosphate-sugar epimerase